MIPGLIGMAIGCVIVFLVSFFFSPEQGVIILAVLVASLIALGIIYEKI